MKLILIITFFFSVSFSLPMEENFFQARILGGQEANSNKFPYQVGIYVTNPPKSKGSFEWHNWCGGSLISEEYILTAAHCLVGGLKADVLLGAHNVTKHEEPGRILVSINAENFIFHSDYDPYNQHNDIALIKLPGKVKLTDKIQLINLPKSTVKQSSLEGRLATAIGWGKMGDNELTSDTLRFTELKVVKDRVCKFYYPDTFQASIELCVDGSKLGPTLRSVCPGDSGGPLVINEADGLNTIIGITSHVRQEGCEEGYPVVFTRVTAFLDWISKNTGISMKN